MDYKDEMRKAKARQLNAEADLADMEIQVRQQELRTMTTRALIAETNLVTEMERNQIYRASDDHHRVYRFLGTVNTAKVQDAVETLTVFHRVDPGCDITMIIDSPGGGITEGFHLFDTILWLRKEGHHVTTIANGMAASMGGVLLQAGSTRIMTPQSSLLIHEAAFGAGGSMGTVEDQVEYVKMLQERILVILTERSTMSKQQIKNRWKRKNWWLMSDEALKLGFVDEVK